MADHSTPAGALQRLVAGDYSTGAERETLEEQALADHAALEAEVARLQEGQTGVYAALEELSRWPDLPGVPYFVCIDGEVGERAIPPEQVKGIMQAISAHVATLMPFAVESVEARYAIDGLRRREAEKDAELATLQREKMAMIDHMSQQDAEIARLKAALVEFTEASNERDLALAIDSAIHSIDRDAGADTFTVYLFDYDAEQGVGFTRPSLIDALQDAKRYMREVPNVDDVGAEAAKKASDEWFARYATSTRSPSDG